MSLYSIKPTRNVTQQKGNVAKVAVCECERGASIKSIKTIPRALNYASTEPTHDNGHISFLTIAITL